MLWGIDMGSTLNPPLPVPRAPEQGKWRSGQPTSSCTRVHPTTIFRGAQMRPDCRATKTFVAQHAVRTQSSMVSHQNVISPQCRTYLSAMISMRASPAPDHFFVLATALVCERFRDPSVVLAYVQPEYSPLNVQPPSQSSLSVLTNP